MHFTKVITALAISSAANAAAIGVAEFYTVANGQCTTATLSERLTIQDTVNVCQPLSVPGVARTFNVVGLTLPAGFKLRLFNGVNHNDVTTNGTAPNCISAGGTAGYTGIKLIPVNSDVQTC